MKMMGRKHRPFFRICAVDSRAPRDGRVLEELGTYDPMVADTDARALINGERMNYWLGVGALPSDKVKTLIKKYGVAGTHAQQQKAARERLSMPKIVPAAPEPVYIPPAPGAAAESSEGGESSQAAEPAEQPAAAE
jgi:small subunit ribosomal protein S16